MNPPEPIVDYEVVDPETGRVLEISYHFPGEPPNSHRVYAGPLPPREEPDDWERAEEEGLALSEQLDRELEGREEN